MAKNTKMAFEGELYYGTAGSTAAILLTNMRDVTIGLDAQRGDTTSRGSGAGPPVGSSRVTRLNQTLEFTMLLKADDTSLEALRVAAAAGTPVALRGLDYAAGKGPDFDYNMAVSNGQPVDGEQTLQFTCEPTEEGGRIPVAANIYV